ncbi:hypothetical protein POVWA2_031550 [Plasmodium ovale wallikeri]|uniref:Uncharacterized protein n=1 Tax=Plasmodium ovale wallikeri TaxID=864142 RepID=A0A1A8YXQ5_PLAOA|nr:hypothetical protein POVWA1_031830 [Plasmodium ovale wallikeri]SBT36723.1 hypothetical protein POVWA2_031550 [Plasmodium ovale wallikeri]
MEIHQRMFRKYLCFLTKGTASEEQLCPIRGGRLLYLYGVALKVLVKEVFLPLCAELQPFASVDRDDLPLERVVM